MTFKDLQVNGPMYQPKAWKDVPTTPIQPHYRLDWVKLVVYAGCLAFSLGCWATVIYLAAKAVR